MARQHSRVCGHPSPQHSELFAEALERANGNSYRALRLVPSCVVYRFGQLILAPTPELIELLETHTGRSASLMPRGVDTLFFSPDKRRRTDSHFVLGYVGRLMPEKNVRFLIHLERVLHAAGAGPFRFLIVGAGPERRYLEAELKHAEFTGVLSGEPLAEAYANMDLFVFPSRTDTYGNVVQEALSSGVPAVVTDGGGPKFIVEHGRTGFIAADDEEMCRHVLAIMNDRQTHATMRRAARDYALTKSWDAVFELVYEAYRRVVS